MTQRQITEGVREGFKGYFKDIRDMLCCIKDLLVTISNNMQPVDPPVDYEYKTIEVDRCLQDGTKIKEVNCLVFEDGVQTSTSTFWIVNGEQVTEDPGAIDCVECAGKGSQGTIMDWNVLK